MKQLTLCILAIATDSKDQATCKHRVWQPNLVGNSVAYCTQPYPQDPMNRCPYRETHQVPEIPIGPIGQET
jgi:hypothetical protein